MVLKKKLFKLLLIFTLSNITTPLYSSALLTGVIVDNVTESVDGLIRTAFDRLDLSLLQAGMEAQATIKEAEFSLKDVMDHSVDRLDEQQRKLVAQLQQFERLIATDAKKVLKEIREEKNSVFSDIRLMISNYPGAIRIIPKYAIDGAKYIEYKILGTALSKAIFKNMKLNAKPTTYKLIQGDTQIVIRIPISASNLSQLIARSNGKPAEAKISFEIVEYSWFKLFETGKRQFSAIAYIMPKTIGRAQATFSGKVKKIDKNKKFGEGSSKVVESKRSVGIGGLGFNRSRGKDDIKVIISTDRGWRFKTNTANFKLDYIGSGCNKRRSSADFFTKSEHKISVKAHVETHLGYRSVCKIKVVLSAIQWQESYKEDKYSLPEQVIWINNDIKFNLSPNNLLALKNSTLDYVKVRSPLFENGIRYLRPGEEIGGLKLEYNPQIRTGFLRFKYLE